MSKGYLYATVAAAVLGFSTIASAAVMAPANLVVDGGFESQTAFAGWDVRKYSGTTPGTGPQVITTGGVNSTGYGDNVPSIEGTHAAYFVDDNAIESISQTVTLLGNTTYNLSFDLFDTNSGSMNPNFFALEDIVFNRNLLDGSVFLPGDLTVGKWTAEQLTFTTNHAGNYDLSFNFQSGATPAKDVILDDVRLSVPEPMSMALLGSGLLIAGLLRNRRA